jgi:iron complex transport system ATP-binding protein
VADHAQPEGLLVRIDVQNLSVAYGGVTALSQISLHALPGEVLAVVGPNGSGKSSFLKALAGLHPHGGAVHFEGRGRPATGIGYMPQDVSSRVALTVLETVLLGRLGRLGLRVTPQDLESTREVLASLSLEGLAHRTLGELSGGQRQMVFLAQALAGRPTVLLLDEPISALDIRHQLQVLDIVRRQTRCLGLTTIVVLHDLAAAARHADRIALFGDGRLAGVGTATQVLTRRRLADVFGVETCGLRDPEGRLVIVPLHAVRPDAAA